MIIAMCSVVTDCLQKAFLLVILQSNAVSSISESGTVPLSIKLLISHNSASNDAISRQDQEIDNLEELTVQRKLGIKTGQRE